MLNVIAPLNYERYAVLVSPLLVPDVSPVTVKPAPRRVEELSPVNPTSSFSDSQADKVPSGPVSQATDVSQGAMVRNRPPPLHGPPPSDDKNFLALPVHSVGSAQGQTIPDPGKLVSLYDHSENTLGRTIHVSA